MFLFPVLFSFFSSFTATSAAVSAATGTALVIDAVAAGTVITLAATHS